jgi:hypothetical protein
MLVGLLTTIFLIPNTRGADKKPSTLEVLAAEGKCVNNLMKRILNSEAAKSLLPANDERSSREDQGSLEPDVERGGDQGRYTDDVGEQVVERTTWMAQNQPGGDVSGDMELDAISIGDPAIVGPLP